MLVISAAFGHGKQRSDAFAKHSTKAAGAATVL